jgi:hypothetical protein
MRWLWYLESFGPYAVSSLAGIALFGWISGPTRAISLGLPTDPIPAISALGILLAGLGTRAMVSRSKSILVLALEFWVGLSILGMLGTFVFLGMTDPPIVESIVGPPPGPVTMFCLLMIGALCMLNAMGATGIAKPTGFALLIGPLIGLFLHLAGVLAMFALLPAILFALLGLMLILCHRRETPH